MPRAFSGNEEGPLPIGGAPQLDPDDGRSPHLDRNERKRLRWRSNRPAAQRDSGEGGLDLNLTDLRTLPELSMLLAGSRLQG